MPPCSWKVQIHEVKKKIYTYYSQIGQDSIDTKCVDPSTRYTLLDPKMRITLHVTKIGNINISI